ncbi:hypothetical protein HOD08_04795 [bacterium]|nr:hypothetical protein [bacterium]
MKQLHSIAIVVVAGIFVFTLHLESTGKKDKRSGHQRDRILGFLDLTDKIYDRGLADKKLAELMSPTRNISGSEKPNFIAQALTANEGAHKRYSRLIAELESALKNKDHILHKTALEIRNHLILICQQSVPDFACERISTSPAAQTGYKEHLVLDCMKAIVSNEESIWAKDPESPGIRAMFSETRPGIWAALFHDTLGIKTILQNDLGIGN